MDMVTSIASASIGLSSARALFDINVAMMGKALDTARVQEEAITDMLESAVPASAQLLDVYA